MPDFVYKICPEALWLAAEKAGRFDGASVDIADGYIHLSGHTQVRETASRRFAGQDQLVVVTVDASALGKELRWERSRGGELFPHLYAPLPLSAVRKVERLPLDGSGGHAFPVGIP